MFAHFFGRFQCGAQRFKCDFVVPIRRSILQAPNRHHEHAIVAAVGKHNKTWRVGAILLGELARFYLESWRPHLPITP